MERVEAEKLEKELDNGRQEIKIIGRGRQEIGE
jgi:hypothetical protein